MVRMAALVLATLELAVAAWLSIEAGNREHWIVANTLVVIWPVGVLVIPAAPAWILAALGRLPGTALALCVLSILLAGTLVMMASGAAVAG